MAVSAEVLVVETAGEAVPVLLPGAGAVAAAGVELEAVEGPDEGAWLSSWRCVSP